MDSGKCRPSPPNFQLFSLADDPDGLWVAEDDGRILGFAWSWICGDIWFLAQLFVSPDRQGGSVGRELSNGLWITPRSPALPTGF